MSRIFYFCPDFPQPSGGTKTLYRHVHQLRQLGFDAAIVHQKRGFVLTWHPYQAPVIWLEDQPKFGPADICVFPEVMVDYVRQTQNFRGKRVVIALSWAPAYNRLRPGERWQDLGITHVLTKSVVIQRYLQWGMDLSATLVTEYVDPARYFYAPTQKKPQIAYLTRKDPSGDWLQGIFQRKGPPLTSYTWLPLRNMDEASYAQHLRASAIYLVTTLQEGMHVSVLEAMACGCLVVGYAGVGGNAYMIGAGERQNCILVENGNLPLLGEVLEETVRTLLSNQQPDPLLIANARTTAQGYQDPAAEAQSLQAFFAGLLP